MSAMDRKDLVRKYKETPRPAGAYRIRHQPSGRSLVGASPDAPAMLNRIRAQLDMGSHPGRQMQQDWDADGDAAFDFEALDVIEPSDGDDRDFRDDLETLRQMWAGRLGVAASDSY